MKVSVLMPLYNKAPYLREAIDSVLAQTFTDWELIVVDDCSSDESVSIVESYDDPRIKLHKNERNLGTAGNANRCIALSKGEYLVRFDADDICVPDRIEAQVNYMDAHPEVGVSSGHLETFGTETEVWKLPTEDEDLRAMMLFNVPIAQGASIIRKSVLTEHSIEYDERGPNVGEDWLLWFKLAHETKLGNIDKILIKYRRGEQNITYSGNNNLYKSRTYVYRYFFKELGLPEEKTDIHFYTKPFFPTPATATTVVEFREWLDELKAFNEKRKFFHQEKFNRILEEKWDRVFYHLPEFGKEAVKAHFAHSKVKNKQHHTYYTKYRINKMIGRK
jgi:glycosyltransferase involved in cell wall biosynthesis